MASYIRIVTIDATDELESINIALEYMTQNQSEIRDEFYGCNFTDFINRTSDRNVKYIIVHHHQPIGFLAGHLSAKCFKLEFFEIFYPFRGYGYAKLVIRYLEHEFGNVIIIRPLSLGHWLRIMTPDWFRSTIRRIGVSPFIKLMFEDEYHEIIRPASIPLMRRLAYDTSDIIGWKEYKVALEEDIVAPIITIKHKDDDGIPVLPEPSVDMIIDDGHIVVGMYRYNGSFVPLPDEIAKYIHDVKGYEYHFDPSYQLPCYPQIDKELEILYQGESMMLDYKNKVRRENGDVGIMLGRRILWSNDV